MDVFPLTGINKAKLLAGLYNNSKPQGMGFLQYIPGEMTEAEAEEILRQQQDFDYLAGRVMKVSFAKATISGALYDRDNGQGEFRRIYNLVREESE